MTRHLRGFGLPSSCACILHPGVSLRGGHRQWASLLCRRAEAVINSQARVDRMGIGWWVPALHADGSLDVSLSRWFRIEIKEGRLALDLWKRRSALPDDIDSGGSRRIGLLEPFMEPAHRTSILVAPTWTDNCGNGAALNKR